MLHTVQPCLIQPCLPLHMFGPEVCFSGSILKQTFDIEVVSYDGTFAASTIQLPWSKDEQGQTSTWSHPRSVDLGVSINVVTPKSSILIGNSIMNHPVFAPFIPRIRGTTGKVNLKAANGE